MEKHPLKSKNDYLTNPDKSQTIRYHQSVEENEVNWAHKSDEELMVAYQNGVFHAFEEIYHRYAGRIYGYYRYRLGDQPSVDDLFQLTFQKLHQSRLQYDGKYAFRAWLFTICHNALTDFFRQGSRNRESMTSDMQDCEANEEVYSGTVAKMQEMERLPELQKEALKLRYDEGLAFEEIAKRLEVSSGNARQLVSRAIRRLRELLLPD